MKVPIKATAIILARSGSKGMPGKNVAELAGRPAIAWTIDDALEAQTVSRVIVSTDDPRAARIASATEHVTLVERPVELANDTATVDAAARHAHEQLGRPTGPVVILYASVPVRPAGLIDRAVNRLQENHAHSVQSYCPVGKHHPWWTARVKQDTGEIAPWEGDVLNHGVHRRQDLPPAYVPDGGVLVVTPESLHLQIDLPEPLRGGPHAFFGTQRLGVTTEPGEVIDIDSPIDARVAQATLQERLATSTECGGRAGWRSVHR